MTYFYGMLAATSILSYYSCYGMANEKEHTNYLEQLETSFSAEMRNMADSKGRFPPVSLFITQIFGNEKNSTITLLTKILSQLSPTMYNDIVKKMHNDDSLEAKQEKLTRALIDHISNALAYENSAAIEPDNRLPEMIERNKIMTYIKLTSGCSVLFFLWAVIATVAALS